MAVHPDIKTLLRESLPQSIVVAECCVSRQFGYPAAILLFCAIDTIGLFYRNDTNLKIVVDGKKRHIKKDGVQHFFILNSEYFGLSITEKQIKQVHDNFRSLLVHNSSLPPGHLLISAPGVDPFPIVGPTQCVNLPPLLELTKKAVANFIEQIDHIVPQSKQYENIVRKAQE